MKEFNIVIAGVGGQGILTLKRIIATSAFLEGYEVKTSEIHGLSQRGGAVVSHVRFGEEIYSPMVLEGEANLIIGLEPLEALRACYYASKEIGTIFVVDTRKIQPVSVLVEGKVYPSLDEIKQKLSEFSSKVYLVDASSECVKKFGTILPANIYLFGFCIGAKILPLKKENALRAIESCIKPALVELNKKVFENGFAKGFE